MFYTKGGKAQVTKRARKNYHEHFFCCERGVPVRKNCPVKGPRNAALGKAAVRARRGFA